MQAVTCSSHVDSIFFETLCVRQRDDSNAAFLLCSALHVALLKLPTEVPRRCRTQSVSENLRFQTEGSEGVAFESFKKTFRNRWLPRSFKGWLAQLVERLLYTQTVSCSSHESSSFIQTLRVRNRRFSNLLCKFRGAAESIAFQTSFGSSERKAFQEKTVGIYYLFKN